MTIRDEYRQLVADFMLDLVLERKIAPDQAQRLYLTMNCPAASAKATGELVRFDRRVLAISAVRGRWRLPRIPRKRLAAGRLPGPVLASDASVEDEPRTACNCYSTWFCAVHNAGWLL